MNGKLVFFGIQKYAVCKHCDEIRLDHLDGVKCPFASTLFEPKLDELRAKKEKEDEDTVVDRRRPSSLRNTVAHALGRWCLRHRFHRLANFFVGLMRL